MRKINFIKMIASGNDFVIIEASSFQLPASSPQNLAKAVCDRKYGIGADGLLLLAKSKAADIRMRIFNADGSEAEMCGNGARCVAYYLSSKLETPCLPAGKGRQGSSKPIKIETRAGIIESQVTGNNVKIRLTEPKEMKLDIPLKLNNRIIKVNFIDTGVPHTVIFVEGLDKIDVVNLGRSIRYHKNFLPKGTNVDFVEVLNNNCLKVRTYERGVEDETLACGTGAVAAVIVTALSLERLSGNCHCEAAKRPKQSQNIHTKGNEILKVYFKRTGNKFSNVWLEGRARIVYKGAYNV